MKQGMVEDYIHQLAEQHLEQRRKKLSGITSEDGARKRQEEIRQICADLIGPFPERTALTSRIIDRRECDGFDLELAMYESRPGQIVTANFYLPAEKQAPFPAVLINVGHFQEGKAHSDHQRLARLLSRRGIATLVIDAVGQGERIQYFDITLGRSWLGQNVALEHTHIGNLFYLAGHHPLNMMIWDAIRGLDFLVERPEIDAERIGAAGDCCGAMITRMLCCLEPCLAAAACVVSESHFFPLGGEDAEQHLFGALPRGVAPVDAFMAYAPKPLLLCHAIEDKEAEWVKLQREGLTQWFDHFYAGDKVEWFGSEGNGGYSRAARGRTVDFFAQAFGLPHVLIRETQLPVDKPEQLFCTETGQLANGLNTQDWFEYLQELMRAENLPPKLELPAKISEMEAFQAAMREKIRSCLNLPKSEAPTRCEVEGRSMDWGLTVEKGRLIVEDGIYLPYSFYTESDPNRERPVAKPTVLSVHERGLAAIAAQGPWMTRLATSGYNIMVVDIRGTGETRFKDNRRESEAYEKLLLGVEARWARRALGVGVSLFGCRVFDVLRTLSHLRTRDDVLADRVSLAGIGRGALWALYAAALDDQVNRVVLSRSLISYKCLADHRRHNHHFSLYLMGILKALDLPHVATCIAPRPLTLLNSVNQAMERCRTEKVETTYQLARDAYNLLAAEQNFAVLNRDSPVDSLLSLADSLGP